MEALKLDKSKSQPPLALFDCIRGQTTAEIVLLFEYQNSITKLHRQIATHGHFSKQARFKHGMPVKSASLSEKGKKFGHFVTFWFGTIASCC